MRATKATTASCCNTEAGEKSFIVATKIYYQLVEYKLQSAGEHERQHYTYYTD
jgi:hypothetical protein